MMPCLLSFSLIELLHESNLAEEVGFEPTDAFTPTDFKSAALSRSAIPPKNKLSKTSNIIINAKKEMSNTKLKNKQ
jgi:hypothetical protein